MSLYKIANDLRWMNSGPMAGLAEIRLPDLQPGSSIMPGKVNPVICEVVQQIASQVVGNDAAIAFAGAQGTFELNVMVPVMAVNLLASIRLLSSVSVVFADSCIAGLEPNVDRMRRQAESSSAIVTALNPLIGYEAAAKVAKKALSEGRTIRDVVVADRLLSAAEADRVLDVLAMTKGGRL